MYPSNGPVTFVLALVIGGMISSSTTELLVGDFVFRNALGVPSPKKFCPKNERVGVPSFDSLDPRLSFTGRLHADGDLT